jgi:hypothetical protein
VVGNDGLMGLRRIWTISHGHLDHSRDCRRGRYRVAPTNGFLVMCWRPTEVGGDITDTGAILLGRDRRFRAPLRMP